jgi:hypothetical protein
VGKHVGFNPTAAGNLFLGINAFNLAHNAGSFSMTVLVIPSGMLAAVWDEPTDKFIFQGTMLTVSASVFAQNATPERIEFTAAVPGQAPTPICEAVLSGDGTYSCPWNLMFNGSYLHNGPITLGFTLNGRLKNGHALPSVVNPDGTRTGMLRYTITRVSNYYAGYAATDLNQPVAYQKVSGRWTVPQALCSPTETSYAVMWVGITSDASDTSLLAQLGTESACESGAAQYMLWWEMFPAPLVPLDLPVQPGDSVTASITFQHDTFQLTIDDPAAGAHFTTSQPGKTSDTSVAECIVEAPTVIDDFATNSGHVAPLANFGSVSVFCQISNNQPIADGPQNIIYQMSTDFGLTKATTSQLDEAGSTFTVQWHHR